MTTRSKTDNLDNLTFEEERFQQEEDNGGHGRLEEETLEDFQQTVGTQQGIEIRDNHQDNESENLKSDIKYSKNKNQDFKKLVGKMQQKSFRGTHGVLSGDLKPEDGLYEEGQQFHVIDELGVGNFGRADRCRDETSEKLFVRKTVRMAKFKQNEVLCLTKLKHDNIIKIFGVIYREIKEVELYLEYAGCKPLDGYLDFCHPLTLAEKMNMCQQMFSAFLHMSSKGITHMDIKPENLILEKRKGIFRIKLIDFGMARFSGDPIKWAKPLYSAPETCQLVLKKKKNFDVTPKDVGPKADLFSFGFVLLYIKNRQLCLDHVDGDGDLLLKRAELKEAIRLEQPGFLADLIQKLTQPMSVDRIGPEEALEITKSELEKMKGNDIKERPIAGPSNSDPLQDTKQDTLAVEATASPPKQGGLNKLNTTLEARLESLKMSEDEGI